MGKDPREKVNVIDRERRAYASARGTIEKVGGPNVEAVTSRLEGLEYDGPTGRETLRAADHQCIKAFYLGVGKTRPTLVLRA